MADEKDRIETEDRTEAPLGTDTGPGVGTSSVGIPAGGGDLAGSGTDSAGHRAPVDTTDTDTGMTFGIGQGTTTGTLPTDGGGNLDGTAQGGTLPTATRHGDEPPHGGAADDYSDPRTEEDRRSRHGGADRADVS